MKLQNYFDLMKQNYSTLPHTVYMSVDGSNEPQRLTLPSSALSVKFLLTRCYGQLTAIKIRSVVEIILQPDIELFVDALSVVSGVVHHRKKQIPLVDIGNISTDMHIRHEESSPVVVLNVEKNGVDIHVAMNVGHSFSFLDISDDSLDKHALLDLKDLDDFHKKHKITHTALQDRFIFGGLLVDEVPVYFLDLDDELTKVEFIELSLLDSTLV